MHKARLRVGIRVGILMGMLFTVHLLAQDAVSSVIEAYKVVLKEDGAEKLKKTDRANPGDIIEYQVVYHNKSTAKIQQLKPVLPVPEGMAYLPERVSPADVWASTDGKKFSRVPLRQKVTLPNGQTELQIVPYGKYRYLQWQIDRLNSGRKVRVKARMKILSSQADKQE